MRRPLLALCLLVAGCAAAPPPPPGELPFARGLLARSSEAPVPPPTRRIEIAALPALPEWPPPESEIVSAGRLEALAPVAADDGELARFLESPVSAADLAALGVLRSPEVRSARARVEAVRTSYRQSADLEDLVAVYRSFARASDVRVGPGRSRRATAAIAPPPNVSSLSADLARKTEESAREDLRAALIDVVVEAEEVHADGARLAEAMRIVSAETKLAEALVAAAKTAYEAGSATQAGYLAFRTRLAELRAEEDVLAAEAGSVRARVNRLLSRPGSAALSLDLEPARGMPEPGPGAAPRFERAALERRPSHRKAVVAVERAELALRLAETMALPRMDLGSSRFEREMRGEDAVGPVPVFPEPGRTIVPRSDFGVREAQIEEMRARRDALVAARAASADRVEADVRTALAAVESAARRVGVLEVEAVPLAERSLASIRGAWEGNRAGYLDLLDADRRLLVARLGLADARRDLARSRAGILAAVGSKEALEGER